MLSVGLGRCQILEVCQFAFSAILFNIAKIAKIFFSVFIANRNLHAEMKEPNKLGFLQRPRRSERTASESFQPVRSLRYFGSHSSNRLPSGSVAQPNRP